MSGSELVRREREPELVSQLYRLQAFDWGGLHQNSLEKTIVDNYVKKITSYESLTEKIENELHNSMRGYVLCSWYNHWTSIIIEDVFRDHPNVFGCHWTSEEDRLLHSRRSFRPQGDVSARGVH